MASRNKFPVFYKPRRRAFAVIETADHRIAPELAEPNPYRHSLLKSVIYFSNRILGFLDCLLSSSFPTKICMRFCTDIIYTGIGNTVIWKAVQNKLPTIVTYNTRHSLGASSPLCFIYN